jgi:hypothetical protein
MSDPTLPPSLAAELADLRRRLDALERSPRLPSSSIRGGTFRFLDSLGNPRFVLGNAKFDGTVGGVTDAYGVFTFGDGGTVIAAAREGGRGQLYPTSPIPIHTPAPIAVTSATFVGVYESGIQKPHLEVVSVQMYVITDAATTGEVRLNDSYSGTTTAVASVPASAAGYARFEWLHPAKCGLYDTRPGRLGSLGVDVHARRVTGTGNVTVYTPRIAELSSLYLIPTATADGNPSFT